MWFAWPVVFDMSVISVVRVFCAKSADFGAYSSAWTVAGTAAWTIAAETFALLLKTTT